MSAEASITKQLIHEDHEDRRNAVTHLRAIREQDKNLAHQMAVKGLEHGFAQRQPEMKDG
jgi:hypothetical protein